MNTRFALIALPLILSGCASFGLPKEDVALRDLLRNPLYAEYYYDDLTEQMVTLALREDPILEEPGIRSVVDRARTRSLEHAALAVKAQEKGRRGGFISERELAAGDALLLENVLYIGPTFNVAPGPALSVYLTTLVDPRDAAPFPDPTAVRLGGIKNNYGAQSYAVPPQPEPTGTGASLRTAVLWDDDLGILYGFAQLTMVLGN